MTVYTLLYVILILFLVSLIFRMVPIPTFGGDRVVFVVVILLLIFLLFRH